MAKKKDDQGTTVNFSFHQSTLEDEIIVSCNTGAGVKKERSNFDTSGYKINRKMSEM